MATLKKSFKIGTRFQMGSSDNLFEVWSLGILHGLNTVNIKQGDNPMGFYFEDELLTWIKTGFVKIIS